MLRICCAEQVNAGVKGVSPGPFTEEFLGKQQRNLRILGGLCMAGTEVSGVDLYQQSSVACARQMLHFVGLLTVNYLFICLHVISQ